MIIDEKKIRSIIRQSLILNEMQNAVNEKLETGLSLGTAARISVRDRQQGIRSQSEGGSQLSNIDSLSATQYFKNQWKSASYEGRSFQDSEGFIYDPSKQSTAAGYRPSEPSDQSVVLAIGYGAGVGRGNSNAQYFKSGNNTGADSGQADVFLGQQVSLASSLVKEAFSGTKLTGGMFNALVLLFLDFTFLPPGNIDSYQNLRQRLDQNNGPIVGALTSLKGKLDEASEAPRGDDEEREASNGLYRQAGDIIRGTAPTRGKVSSTSSKRALVANLFNRSIPSAEGEEDSEDTTSGGAL